MAYSDEDDYAGHGEDDDITQTQVQPSLTTFGTERQHTEQSQDLLEDMHDVGGALGENSTDHFASQKLLQQAARSQADIIKQANQKSNAVEFGSLSFSIQAEDNAHVHDDSDASSDSGGESQSAQRTASGVVQSNSNAGAGHRVSAMHNPHLGRHDEDDDEEMEEQSNEDPTPATEIVDRKYLRSYDAAEAIRGVNTEVNVDSNKQPNMSSFTSGGPRTTGSTIKTKHRSKHRHDKVPAANTVDNESEHNLDASTSADHRASVVAAQIEAAGDVDVDQGKNKSDPFAFTEGTNDGYESDKEEKLPAMVTTPIGPRTGRRDSVGTHDDDESGSGSESEREVGEGRAAIMTAPTPQSAIRKKKQTKKKKKQLAKSMTFLAEKTSPKHPNKVSDKNKKKKQQQQRNEEEQINSHKSVSNESSVSAAQVAGEAIRRAKKKELKEWNLIEQRSRRQSRGTDADTEALAIALRTQTFNAVWKTLSAEGWHHENGNNLVDWYYLMPDIKKKSEGYLDVNMFTEKGVVEYARRKRPELLRAVEEAHKVAQEAKARAEEKKKKESENTEKQETKPIKQSVCGPRSRSESRSHSRSRSESRSRSRSRSVVGRTGGRTSRRASTGGSNDAPVNYENRVWPFLKAEGWTHVSGDGLEDWYYLRKGVTKKSGATLNVDMFTGDGLVEYAFLHRPELMKSSNDAPSGSSSNTSGNADDDDEIMYVNETVKPKKSVKSNTAVAAKAATGKKKVAGKKQAEESVYKQKYNVSKSTTGTSRRRSQGGDDDDAAQKFRVSLVQNRVFSLNPRWNYFQGSGLSNSYIYAMPGFTKTTGTMGVNIFDGKGLVEYAKHHNPEWLLPSEDFSDKTSHEVVEVDDSDDDESKVIDNDSSSDFNDEAERQKQNVKSRGKKVGGKKQQREGNAYNQKYSTTNTTNGMTSRRLSRGGGDALELDEDVDHKANLSLVSNRLLTEDPPWRYINGDLTSTYFYVMPGVDKNSRKLGMNMFGEKGLIKYARENRPELLLPIADSSSEEENIKNNAQSEVVKVAKDKNKSKNRSFGKTKTKTDVNGGVGNGNKRQAANVSVNESTSAKKHKHVSKSKNGSKNGSKTSTQTARGEAELGAGLNVAALLRSKGWSVKAGKGLVTWVYRHPSSTGIGDRHLREFFNDDDEINAYLKANPHWLCGNASSSLKTVIPFPSAAESSGSGSKSSKKRMLDEETLSSERARHEGMEVVSKSKSNKQKSVKSPRTARGSGDESLMDDPDLPNFGKKAFAHCVMLFTGFENNDAHNLAKTHGAVILGKDILPDSAHLQGRRLIVIAKTNAVYSTKYAFALANQVPCLHEEWLFDSNKSGRLQPWRKYQLPACQRGKNPTPFGFALLSPREPLMTQEDTQDEDEDEDDLSLPPHPRPLSLLKGQNAIIVSSRKETIVNHMGRLLETLGATLLQDVQETKPSVAIADPNEEATDATRATKTELPDGVPILNWEWLMDSIHGQKLTPVRSQDRLLRMTCPDSAKGIVARQRAVEMPRNIKGERERVVLEWGGIAVKKSRQPERYKYKSLRINNRRYDEQDLVMFLPSAAAGDGQVQLPPLFETNAIPYLLRFGIVQEFSVDADSGHWRVRVDELVLVDAESAGVPGATVLRPTNESISCNVSKIASRAMYVNVEEAKGKRYCAASIPWDNRVYVVDVSENVAEAKDVDSRGGRGSPGGSTSKRSRSSPHRL